MNDSISRQAAIEAVRSYYDECDTSDKSIEERIEDLPSVQPEQQWIPVTERLPERTGYYLVTGRQGAVNKRGYEDGYWYGNWSVIAWMPLPEPYKGEQE